ncbi:HMG CoA reductase [Metarhizium album ARSEF 1941]|uniref:3-hydroxy-3-methylglutaryl coenzyme A reductase n=1 Tax=Metarhizium album (strain ARSEF 1941) TaxID=1081103 RepID=A0A0B2WFI1_METAS|nr:HMG CoA reductase [Metarhizium album ARSEF 1941]KHN94691.1 HMG CoA reductase [Metarhizium album ARSEF 1941]
MATSSILRRMTQGQSLLDQQDSASSTLFSYTYRKPAVCLDPAAAENSPKNQCRKPNRRVTFSDHFDMITSSFLPTRFRGEPDRSQSSAAPSRVGKKLAPWLQLLGSIACRHPIHTVVIVAVLASTSYVGLIQNSLSEDSLNLGKADWSSLVEGSRDLVVGPDTQWKWQSIDQDVPHAADANHLALLTFVFPDTSSTDSSSSAPRSHVVPTPQNLSITPLPVTENSFNTYTLDSILAYSIPKKHAPEFVSAAKEIPDEQAQEIVTRHGREKKKWIMKAAKVNTRNTIVQWLRNAWVEFIDLLKNAETLDIVIMVLGYLSMHLTFVSLFLSMRRMGSNFWLGMSTLFSSVFAFLFGLAVTTKLGVPISVILLSEGLPFLVVTIGFEKNIVLTRAVLSHAVEHRRTQAHDARPGGKFYEQTGPQNVISYAVQAAIKDKGYEILRDYAIEIAILSIGAASGVQGGLQQFCFLAAWILFFDCILLFTFYTAILSIKLEINRIKRHYDMRMALEADGVSRRVAENVAKSNDWAQSSNAGSKDTTLFGRMRSSSVPKFKVLMISGFILINVINICTIPFRSAASLSTLRSWAGGLGGVASTLPVDPYKVAKNGLDAILTVAQTSNTPTRVTVLTPIKYELEYPSVHYALSSPFGESSLASDDSAVQFDTYGVGGRMVGSLLKSLEDPVLSKWIVIALALSVGLNGYLFNVARWSIKDPNMPHRKIDRKELARAQQFNDTESATLPLGEYVPPTPVRTDPVTPALTDDEGDGLRMRKAKPAGPQSQSEHRPVAELEELLAEKRTHELSDEEVVTMSMRGKIPGYALEKALKDFTRAVKIRRTIIARTKATSGLTHGLDSSLLPYEHYNWEQVFGACCENVIGYLPLPVGVAGPLVIDGQSYFIPMATTEGVLVASTSRGCKAINSGGGAITVLTSDGMTRGPCVSFETLERAGAAKLWLDSEVGQNAMKIAFDSTSGYARLQHMKTALAGTNLYIRFKTTTGDAMGMNMISKGVEHALNVMATEGGFDDMNIVTVSGNFCIDKKPAALNWIDGRGKGVVAEAIIPADVVKSVLKSDVDALVELNVAKNLIGSAMAGSIGGFNAHAANIVAAIFLATGQDPAQVVESANCITTMKK